MLPNPDNSCAYDTVGQRGLTFGQICPIKRGRAKLSESVSDRKNHKSADVFARHQESGHEQDRWEYTPVGKRDKFVAELRQLARDKGLKFQEQKWRGKGGHAMIWVGDKVTTLPSREIDPKTAKKILKALGLDDP